MTIACDNCGNQLAHVRVRADAIYTGDCDTCSIGEAADITIEVECTKCKKLVHKEQFLGVGVG